MSIEDRLGRLPIYRHVKNEMQKRSDIRSATQALLRLEIEDYLARHLHANPRYQAPGRLNRFEACVFSQFGEDGLLDETFRRIRETNRQFLEIGVGDGLENNTAYRLAKGWTGGWIEADAGHVEKIRATFHNELSGGRLKLHSGAATPENIGGLIENLGVAPDADLLSIDVDQSTYWLWKGITGIKPRVVVVEYNAAFPPSVSWAASEDGSWDGSSHFGASLRAVWELGEKKGYKLVGCNFAGANAFFVRADLIGQAFPGPFTPEFHYEPPRFFLYTSSGHRRGWGSYKSPP